MLVNCSAIPRLIGIVARGRIACSRRSRCRSGRPPTRPGGSTRAGRRSFRTAGARGPSRRRRSDRRTAGASARTPRRAGAARVPGACAAPGRRARSRSSTALPRARPVQLGLGLRARLCGQRSVPRRHRFVNRVVDRAAEVPHRHDGIPLRRREHQERVVERRVAGHAAGSARFRTFQVKALHPITNASPAPSVGRC